MDRARLKRLRRKLEPMGLDLKKMRGGGYLLIDKWIHAPVATYPLTLEEVEQIEKDEKAFIEDAGDFSEIVDIN